MKVPFNTICPYCKSPNCYFITTKKLFYICRSCREIIEPSNNECDYHGLQLDSAYYCIYCMKIKNPLLTYKTIRSIIKNTKNKALSRLKSGFIDNDNELFTETDYDKN
jgi:hypothetical protein